MSRMLPARANSEGKEPIIMLIVRPLSNQTSPVCSFFRVTSKCVAPTLANAASMASASLKVVEVKGPSPVCPPCSSEVFFIIFRFSCWFCSCGGFRRSG